MELDGEDGGEKAEEVEQETEVEKCDADDTEPTTKKIDVSKRNKLIILAVGVVVCLAGIVTVILGSMQPGITDYDGGDVLFYGDIEIREIGDGMVAWKNDLLLSKRKEISNGLEQKMKHALEAEGFSVSAVDVKDLELTDPKTVVRKELTESPGAIAKDANMLDTLKTETKTYADVQYVRAHFTIWGKFSKNAAVLGSSTPAHIEEVGHIMAVRISSTGWTSKIIRLTTNSKFAAVVDNLIAEKPSAVTTPPTTQFDTATLCTCDKTSGDVSASEPLLACKCESSCTDGNVNIYGGEDKRYTCAGSSLCATAYYAGIIERSGGEFEVIYSGEGTAGKGTDKPGFTVRAVDVTMAICTFKDAGRVIPITTPPNTLEAGKFHTTTPAYIQPAVFSGGDDEPQFTPDFPYDGTEDVIAHVRHTNIAGRPAVYRQEYRNVEHKDVVEMMRAAEPQYSRIFAKLGIRYDDVSLRHVVEQDGKQGIVFGLALSGDARTIASGIRGAWKGYNQFQAKIKEAFGDYATLLNIRFGRDVLSALSRGN